MPQACQGRVCKTLRCCVMCSLPDAMKRSLELGSDACAECAVAERLQARGAPAAAAAAAATAHTKRAAAPAEAPPKRETAGTGSAVGAPTAASVSSDADPGPSQILMLEGPANGNGTSSAHSGRDGRRGSEHGGERSGGRGGHNGGTLKRNTARWEARVATGRGTRRAALAEEMAAQASCAAGETHTARITPMQARAMRMRI